MSINPSVNVNILLKEYFETIRVFILLLSDILLKETDTIWMFVLPGTCKEIEGDEDVQRTLKKRKQGAEKKVIDIIIMMNPEGEG